MYIYETIITILAIIGLLKIVDVVISYKPPDRALQYALQHPTHPPALVRLDRERVALAHLCSDIEETKESDAKCNIKTDVEELTESQKKDIDQALIKMREAVDILVQIRPWRD